jgi:hypothetical protein
MIGMAIFFYEGMNAQGERVEGTVRAVSSPEAQDIVRSLGIFATTLGSLCPRCRARSTENAQACSRCGARLDEPSDLSSASRDIEARVLEALRRDHKIEAIKLYREATGAGLRDAKDYVESLARTHHLPGAEPVGCAWKAGMLMVIMIAIGLWGLS